MATNNSLHGAKVEILVMYKECLHNHAAKAMGHVFDGCGQFVANGPNSTPEAMVCAACYCHRNFHKRVEVDLPRPSEMVIPPASLSHPQPPQRHIYQQNPTTQARTTGTRSKNIYQRRGLPSHLSRGFQIPISGSHERQMAEAGFRVRRNKITEEQIQALRAIVERNNLKMFREYANEEVNQICSSIGITKNVMRRWINRQRQKRAAAAAAAAAIEGAEAATAAGGSGKGSRGGNRNSENGDSSSSSSSSSETQKPRLIHTPDQEFRALKL